MLQSLEGNLDMVAKEGLIYEDPAIEKVFAYLSGTKALKGKLPEYREEGLPYDTISAKANLQNGKLVLEEGVFDGPTMHIAAQGEIDLRDRKVDVGVVVSPLRNVDAIVSINASQVSIVIETTDKNADLPTLKNYVEYLVRTVVDAYGYLTGRGYDVEITSVVDPDGKHTVFGVGIPELEEAQNERPLHFPELLEVMGRSQHLHRALGDLREAIRSPWDTGFFCHRAVECIRQSFVKEEDGDDKGPSWKSLRNELRIDRSWIEEYTKKSADAQRHGSTPYMSGEDRVLAMKHAWKVIDRFCVYVYGGFKSLSKNDFDMLKES